MNRLPLILSLLVVIMIVTACNDDSCDGNGSSLPLAAFYVGEKQQAIYGLTIKGIGVPGDSVLYNGAAISEAYLPLRASTTSTSYAFSRQYINGQDTLLVKDTLTLDYEPVVYFHSQECGAMFNFDLKRVTCTDNSIDSVVLLTTLVTNSRTPALRIYFTE